MSPNTKRLNLNPSDHPPPRHRNARHSCGGSNMDLSTGQFTHTSASDQTPRDPDRG